eukprot:CAMPEP_0196587628 /NCGR_PEP_ID=MMETSP1081-20130531/58094_1 /TAXON_ID=36882 /ORGANISM="Pyramimonas amylifera, Strain CCMP720" /LENGTH=743 /DNA_ID=CAMNT_0041909867 /DNA_START=360 /DNA_END=2591 /DNA_ORIENTATION=+
MSSQMKDMRASMEEDEQLSVLMRGLRGQGMNEDDFAAADTQMRLLDFSSSAAVGDELPLAYDPELIDQYWSKRPGLVAQRALQLLGVSAGFIFNIVSDIVLKRTKEKEVERACEIREIVTSLGPAYIKLGQALAIRPDILSPAAMNELQKLCDKVPAFDNAVAMRTITEELGQSPHEIYDNLTPDPIAAASLGQVYRGTLRATGEDVAVKVQRPNVLETVTVDLYVLRRVGMALRDVPQINTDIVALLDEWAMRFFEELDYVHEGANATKFAKQMEKDLPQVVVPRTFPTYTSRRVLTSSWLDGEKLSQSTADDVGALVKLGVICYLKQLLDTGFFHADPHPGNLIRTPDGRLAILDFGLMTDVSDDIKFGMIEAIAHLIHRDYEAIVEDFVTLQFIPSGVDLKPILPVLARVFDQALDGGGAKNINFQELSADLAQITFDYPFRIPPYFALIIRAISVLEGIALVGDSDFALVDEAFPYLAKRLLTDDTPRLRAALKYMIYGKSESFDVDRMIDLLEALESFNKDSTSSQGDLASPSPALLPAPPSAASSASSTIVPLPNTPFNFLIPSFTPPQLFQPPQASVSLTSQSQSARDALTFILSPEGVLFRELLLEELVKGIDALSRDQVRALVVSLGLGDARVPVLLPGALRPLALAPHMTLEDQVIIANTNKLIKFLSGTTNTSQFTPESAQLLLSLSPFVPNVAQQILPEVASRLSGRVFARFIKEVFVDNGAINRRPLTMR